MISTEQHLKPEQVDAFIDHEATGSDALIVEQHLATCHACSLRVLSAMELKRATAEAGKRVTAPPEALARLTSQVQGRSKRARLYVMPPVAWAAIAACLLLAIGASVWGMRRGPETLSAELLDQHLAALSSAALPQVISSDRHTVKPWFQGRLPFSFNLPEPADLPADTVLRGANLTYVHGQPAALLFFTMRKHQVSVFLAQRDRILAAPSSSPLSTRSGFTIESRDAAYLTLIAVSDVNPADLHTLLSSLVRVQVKP